MFLLLLVHCFCFVLSHQNFVSSCFFYLTFCLLSIENPYSVHHFLMLLPTFQYGGRIWGKAYLSVKIFSWNGILFAIERLNLSSFCRIQLLALKQFINRISFCTISHCAIKAQNRGIKFCKNFFCNNVFPQKFTHTL